MRQLIVQLAQYPIRNGFSVGRLSQNQLMKSVNLSDHTSLVYAIEFSNDGSLLVSGGEGGRILMWKMEQVLDWTRTASTLKVTPKNFSARSLAISADNSRIFAGGSVPGICVFDTNTWVLKGQWNIEFIIRTTFHFPFFIFGIAVEFVQAQFPSYHALTKLPCSLEATTAL